MHLAHWMFHDDAIISQLFTYLLAYLLAQKSQNITLIILSEL